MENIFNEIMNKIDLKSLKLKFQELSFDFKKQFNYKLELNAFPMLTTNLKLMFFTLTKHELTLSVLNLSLTFAVPRMNGGNGDKLPTSSSESSESRDKRAQPEILCRAPIQPPPLFNLINRPPIPLPAINRFYESIDEHTDHSFSAPNYSYVRETYLNPWLVNFPPCDQLDGHTIIKPFPGEWCSVPPSEAHIRLRPLSEHNMVLTMAVHEHFLLIGLSLGQILSYDLNGLHLIRSYQVHEQYGVRQIICGKKLNRFYACAYDTFLEYSYFDSRERYRFRNHTFIKSVLYVNNPMLIIDLDGWVHVFRDEAEIKIYPIGKLFNKLSYIEELRSFDLMSGEQARPCLLRFKCCLAIVNISLYSEHKLSVWKKELISLDPNDHVAIACFEDKLFYATVPKTTTQTSTAVFISRIRDFGYANRVDILRTTSGVLVRMRASENKLLIFTRTQQMEIFDIRSNIKVSQISFKMGINTMIVARNMLIVGTYEACLISQSLSMTGDEVCRQCEVNTQSEGIRVYERCEHNIVPEQTHRLYF